MNTATLGGLIKDYRLKKRLSQLDISLKIGWKDTSRLSKIEQGRVNKPNRQTAEKIIKALDLTEKEKGYFLLVGGYLPTDEEVKNGIDQAKEKIDTWAYPAYLQDFSFRYLYCNDNFLKMLNLPQKYKKIFQEEKPNLAITTFEPEYTEAAEDLIGQDEKSLVPANVALSSMLKYDFDEYQNEAWYKKLIKDLMQFKDFRELWPTLTENSFDRLLVEYDYEEFRAIYMGKKRTLKFHLTTARFVNDARFQVLLYYPADRETEKFFTKQA